MPKPSHKPAPPTEYEMPFIGQGWPVIWRHSDGEPPCTGIVTAVFPRAVDILVFPPGSSRGLLKQAVRHSGDPLRKAIVAGNDDGLWDHTTFGERLIAFETAVAEAETTAAPSE